MVASYVPGRMPALFHSVNGVLCNRFHPWFTQSVYAGHTGKGQKVGEYGRLHRDQIAENHKSQFDESIMYDCMYEKI